MNCMIYQESCIFIGLRFVVLNRSITIPQGNPNLFYHFDMKVCLNFFKKASQEHYCVINSIISVI